MVQRANVAAEGFTNWVNIWTAVPPTSVTNTLTFPMTNLSEVYRIEYRR